MRYQHPRTIYVILECTGERRDEEHVDFVDISEDMQGRDRLTFQCPECQQVHTSYRLG